MSGAELEQLEGLNQIAAFLRLPSDWDGEAQRKRLRRWIRDAGMPVRFVCGKYLADPLELQTWWDAQRVKKAG